MARIPLNCGVQFDRAVQEKLDKAVEQIVAGVPSTIAVYVFGSLAAGTLTADSDVDLAVLAAQPLAAEARWHLAQTLAMELGRDVDLVDLRQASTVMRVQVLGSGKLLLELDRGARQEFEAVALAAYARLNEERRGIIDDIRARGSVYG